MLYNFQLIRLAGEDGVAAYGVIMYVNLIFCRRIHRLFHRQCAGRQLSLRGRQPRVSCSGLLRRSLGILAVIERGP